MNETQAHQPSAMSCIQFMRGFCPFLNDFPSLYNVIRFIYCLAPECPLLLQDYLDQGCYHSCWMLMASFAIPECVCSSRCTHFFWAPPLSLPWYCLMGCVYQHIQPQLIALPQILLLAVIICDCWSNWMQERDIPEEWTTATIKQNNAGFSTRPERMSTGPPGLLTG